MSWYYSYRNGLLEGEHTIENNSHFFRPFYKGKDDKNSMVFSVDEKYIFETKEEAELLALAINYKEGWLKRYEERLKFDINDKTLIDHERIEAEREWDEYIENKKKSIELFPELWLTAIGDNNG